MNSWIEGPPPRERSRGCFPSGCFLVLALAVLLVIAFLAGGFFGMRYLLAPTRINDAPQALLSPNEQQTTEQRWSDFEQRARNGEAARAEFTIAEINHLIDVHRRTSYLAIANNVGHVRFNLPLGRTKFAGHYTSIAGWLDGLADELSISHFEIDGARVVIEANGSATAESLAAPAVTPPIAATPPQPAATPNADALTTPPAEE